MKNNKFYNLVYSKKNRISSKYKNLFIGKWLYSNFLNKRKLNIQFYDHDWLNKKKRIKRF